MKNSDNNSSLDSRINQTLKNVQGLLKGRSIPGKVLLTRRADPPEDPSLRSSTFGRSFSENDAGTSDQMDMSKEAEAQGTSKQLNNNMTTNKLKPTNSNVEITSKEVQKSVMGARATDSARVMKFTKELSGSTVTLGMLVYACILLWINHVD